MQGFLIAPTALAESSADRIRAMLPEPPGSIAPKSIIEATGIPEGTVYATLRRLLQGGEAEQVESGGYRKASGKPMQGGVPARLRQKLEVADEIIHIPEVQIEPDAGAGTDTAGYDLEEVNGELRLPAWYIRAEYGVEPSRVRQIRTRGNSMQPTIYPGQRLLVALWEGEPLQDGLVYVIYGPHGLMIKRLFLREDEEGRRWVVVSSDNRKRVEPFRVPADRFEADYRIIAVALEINRKL